MSYLNVFFLLVRFSEGTFVLFNLFVSIVVMISFENSFCRIKEDKDGIIHSTLLKCFGITEAEVDEYISVCEKFGTDTPKKVLIDFREINCLTPAALKKFSSEKVAKGTKAAAVLVSLKSPLVSAIVSLILTFSKEPYPIKIFTKEDEALKWLKEFS